MIVIRGFPRPPDFIIQGFPRPSPYVEPTQRELRASERSEVLDPSTVPSRRAHLISIWQDGPVKEWALSKLSRPEASTGSSVPTPTTSNERNR